MDAITKRIRKATVRERTKKAYTTNWRPYKPLKNRPARKCPTCKREFYRSAQVCWVVDGKKSVPISVF